MSFRLQVLHGDEEHVSGWDLVYDNGYIEIDPGQCGYTSFLGAAVPEIEGGGQVQTPAASRPTSRANK